MGKRKTKQEKIIDDLVKQLGEVREEKNRYMWRLETAKENLEKAEKKNKRFESGIEIFSEKIRKFNERVDIFQSLLNQDVNFELKISRDCREGGNDGS